MLKLNLLKGRTRHISKALIRQHLEDSDPEDGEIQITSPDLLSRKTIIPSRASTEDLLCCKSWLDQLCEEEQAQINEASENPSSWLADSSSDNAPEVSNTQVYCHDVGAECPTLDTKILRRIHQGCGPRDTVPEDVLAVFRDNASRKDGTETYEEMREVLVLWNERISIRLGEHQDARAMLRLAIERRSSLLKSCTHGIDRKQALEDSSTKLLRVLTALRPEIAGFRNQESFDILTMMWANVRIAIPDLDDELMLLTMKALFGEVESRSNVKNAKKLSGLARSLSVARLEHNVAEIELLEAKMQAFEQKIRDTAVRKVIDRIKTMRRELMHTKLKELQELTELQAAQKWAIHVKFSGGQYTQNLSRACDQENGKLQRVLQQQAPEMDAHVQVVQNNAKALAGMSANLLSRAKEAGFSLENEQSSGLVELAKADIRVYVTGTVSDILHAREEAAKMLGRMDIIEGHLDVLLDAAKSQYRAYDDVLRVLEEAESLNASGDKEVGLAEKYGSRRESVMLMARNMQRVKIN